MHQAASEPLCAASNLYSPNAAASVEFSSSMDGGTLSRFKTFLYLKQACPGTHWHWLILWTFMSVPCCALPCLCHALLFPHCNTVAILMVFSAAIKNSHLDFAQSWRHSSVLDSCFLSQITQGQTTANLHGLGRFFTFTHPMWAYITRITKTYAQGDSRSTKTSDDYSTGHPCNWLPDDPFSNRVLWYHRSPSHGDINSRRRRGAHITQVHISHTDIPDHLHTHISAIAHTHTFSEPQNHTWRVARELPPPRPASITSSSTMSPPHSTPQPQQSKQAPPALATLATPRADSAPATAAAQRQAARQNASHFPHTPSEPSPPGSVTPCMRMRMQPPAALHHPTTPFSWVPRALRHA